ncbi:MAG TPA: RNA polymerase sigma-70 factor [Sunxiuqinia sp.]|nr:RNA polymerase sigma-70 factor [Sunxiuqinia sp.]
MKQEEKDSSWFREIFNEHYKYLRNFIYYLSGDLELTDDLTQDVFLHLWEEQEKIHRETVKSYLFTVAKNLYFKHHRKKNTHLNFTSSLLNEQDNESPEFLLELKEFDRKLQDAIAEIPDKTRAIFLMSRIDNMTYAEIAERMQLSTKAVEKHMSKAMKMLQQKVDRKL